MNKWQIRSVFQITKYFSAALIIISLQGCELSDRDLLAPIAGREEPIEAEITKWFNDHKAAVALNYDHGYPTTTSYARDALALLKKHNAVMDYDIVTHSLMQSDSMKSFILNEIIPSGMGVFGHGHKHDNHDDKSYDDAYASFKQCYDDMVTLGIKPVSYAYPGGWGYHLSTRKALKDAGFLNGRKFEQLDISNPFIMPDEKLEPRDWYALPTLIMQSEDYDGCIVCVNNAEELAEYLDRAIEKTAWLILTYHFIGDLNNYGFYYLPEFERDLIAVKSRDIWNDKMDNITLYAYERKGAQIEAVKIFDENDRVEKIEIKIDDGLPNDIFDQPLTVKFELPEEWGMKKLKVKSPINSEFYINPIEKSVLINILPNEVVYTIEPNL
ncbi:MAG: polysaccharide deacetylase family protein [Ignavibacteriae bacterium]|nr:polysaccharide deacetylase family protein [Ignavibacteriota bacterium]